MIANNKSFALLNSHKYNFFYQRKINKIVNAVKVQVQIGLILVFMKNEWEILKWEITQADTNFRSIQKKCKGCIA